MKEVTVVDFSRQDIKQILTAQSATFDKENSLWIFRNGNIVSIDSGGQTTNVQYEK